MIVYHLADQSVSENLENYQSSDNYFIALASHEIHSLDALEIDPAIIEKISHSHESVNFISYHGFDFLSFMFYELENETFIFDKCSLLLGSNFVIFIYSTEESLGKLFFNHLLEQITSKITTATSLPFVYYYFLSQSFSSMFASLNKCETLLNNMEDALLSLQENATAIDKSNLHFTKLIKMRNSCFQLKKFNRQLLYLGDQLLLNDNDLIRKKEMRYFHNLDTNINILYEYSADICEMSEHLVAVFDSQATYHTNALLSKLTILMAIATPLTLITGLYGMNFVNMPELQHENGYFITLGVMFCILVITLLFLKRKKIL